MHAQRKIGIVGLGSLGVAAAQALAKQGLANDIVMIDVQHEDTDGEALRLIQRHSPIGGISLRTGACGHLDGADLVIIASQVWNKGDDKTGETGTSGINGAHVDDSDRAPARRAWPQRGKVTCAQRAQHLSTLRRLVRRLDEHAPDATILVASEPVDMLTFTIQEMSTRPVERTLGLGTLPDTLRFKRLLGEHYGVHRSSVEALIVGVHGRSEVPLWSHISIGGHSALRGRLLGQTFEAARMWRLFDEGQCRSYQADDGVVPEVREALCMAVSSIMQDEQRVLPVSTRLQGALAVSGVCLSLPCVVGQHGVHSHILPDLSDEEHEALQVSAGALRRSLRRLKKDLAPTTAQDDRVLA